MTFPSKFAVVLAIVMLQGAILFAILRVEREREQIEPPFAVERVEPRAAPALMWTTVDGSIGHVEQARGSVLVLHFWATWCPPCVAELPGLIELGREGNVRVIAVSLDDDWEVVREFFGGVIPAEVVRASPNDVAKAYGVSTLPETWIVDADGLVRLRIAGERDWRTQGARMMLRDGL
jgi:thiol-disulfide isomerase/thioredoxin